MWWQQKRKRDFGRTEGGAQKKRKGRGKHGMTSYLDILEEQQEYEREVIAVTLAFGSDCSVLYPILVQLEDQCYS